MPRLVVVVGSFPGSSDLEIDNTGNRDELGMVTRNSGFPPARQFAPIAVENGPVVAKNRPSCVYGRVAGGLLFFQDFIL